MASSQYAIWQQRFTFALLLSSFFIFISSLNLHNLNTYHQFTISSVITTFINNCLSANEHCISLVEHRFWTHFLCGAWNRADEPVWESRMGQMKKKMTHASPSVISVIHSPSIAEWQLHQEPSTTPRTINSTDKPNFTHCTQFQCRCLSRHRQIWEMAAAIWFSLGLQDIPVQDIFIFQHSEDGIKSGYRFLDIEF